MNNKEFKEKANALFNRFAINALKKERKEFPNAIIFQIEKEMGVTFTSYDDLVFYTNNYPVETYPIVKKYTIKSPTVNDRTHFSRLAGSCKQIDYFDFLYEEVQKEYVFGKGSDGYTYFFEGKLPKGYEKTNNYLLSTYREDIAMAFTFLPLKQEHLDKLFILVKNRIEGVSPAYDILSKKKYLGIFEECRKIIKDKNSSEHLLWCAYGPLLKLKNPEDKKYFKIILDYCNKQENPTMVCEYGLKRNALKAIKDIEAGKWTKKEK